LTNTAEGVSNPTISAADRQKMKKTQFNSQSTRDPLFANTTESATCPTHPSNHFV